MTSKGKNYLTNQNSLKSNAYKDGSLLEKRRALYKFTTPHYQIEEVVIGLLQLQGKENILDIGCGQGKLLLKAAEKYPQAKFTGVDISSGIYKVAEKESKKHHLSITFLEQDVQQLTFPDNSFDRVTAVHMLYHVPDKGRALAQIARVLKPSGLLVLTANSLKSKPTKRKLKSQVAKLMGLKKYPDTTEIFNIDSGKSLLKKYFKKVKLIPYESKLIIKETKPYVNYFDSTREFWKPYPTDKQWKQALDTVHKHVQHSIDINGQFKEVNLFGAFIASQ